MLIPPNKTASAALVFKNETGKPVHFYANLHQYLPAEQSYGFKITCLCNHHVHSVPPGATWVRIVKFKAGGSFVNRNLRIRHDIIGLTDKEMKDQGLFPYVDNSNEAL